MKTEYAHRVFCFMAARIYNELSGVVTGNPGKLVGEARKSWDPFEQACRFNAVKLDKEFSFL